MAWGPERLKDAELEKQEHVTCISGENELVGVTTGATQLTRQGGYPVHYPLQSNGWYLKV